MSSYPNFYSNACMLLGSLKRGVCHKHPFVTFPVSKVGLDLARILQNLGVIASYECFQNTKRIPKNHYKRWRPASPQQQPTSTTAFQRVPHVYLKLNLSYDKFHPKSLAPGASPLDFNRSFFAPTPERVEVLSSTRQQRFVSSRGFTEIRQNYGPGIFLVSTSRGLLTDIEAEHYRSGGVVMAFLGLPLSHVLQIRGMLVGKFAQEEGQKRREPLQSWSLSAAVRHELAHRADGPQAVGSRVAEILSLDEQREHLTTDLARIRKSDSLVISQLEQHQEQLQRQVVAWSRRGVLQQLIEQEQDEYSYPNRRGPQDDFRGGGSQAAPGRRRLQDY